MGSTVSRVPSLLDWLWSRHRSRLQHPTSPQGSAIIWPEWLDQLDQPQVHIEAYGGQSIHSLGSCVLHLHIDNKVFPTIFEITNITGPVILGRTQAKAMGYVQFPQIWWPHALTTFPNASRKLCTYKTPTPKTTPYSQAHISKKLNPKSLFTKPSL